MKRLLLLFFILVFASFASADNSRVTDDLINCASSSGYILCDTFSDASINASLWRTTSGCTGPTEADDSITLSGTCRTDQWGGATVFEPFDNSRDWSLEIHYINTGNDAHLVTLSNITNYNTVRGVCMTYGDTSVYAPEESHPCSGSGVSITPTIFNVNLTLQYYYNSSSNSLTFRHYNDTGQLEQTIVGADVNGNLTSLNGLNFNPDHASSSVSLFYAIAWNGTPADAPYIAGAGLTFVNPTPANGVTNDTQVILNVSCDVSTNNVTLWFDNNTNPVNEVLSAVPSPGQFLTNVTINGEYFYKGSCDEGTTNSTIRSWTFDDTLPVIVTDFVNNTRVFNINLSGEFNFSDNILLNSVNFSIDGITIFANESINQPTFDHFLNFDTRSLTRGFHELTVRVADAHTASKLREEYEVDRGLIFNNELKYTFPDGGYVKSTVKDGSLLDVWYSERDVDRYRQRLVPANPTGTIVIVEESNHYIQIVDARGLFKGEWIIIDDHWKDYVIDNEPQSKVSIQRITDYKVEVTISNLLRPEDIQFDSVGDLNVITNTYNFTAQSVTETFDSVIFNGFSTIYLLDIFNPPIPNPIAILDFNGTNFTASVDFSNVNQVRYTHTLTPNITSPSVSTPVFHQWYFNLTSAFDFTDVANQTLFNVTVDNCTVNTFPIINLSYVDEVDGFAITATNVYEFAFFDGNNFINISGEFTGHQSDSFCTNINPNVSVFNFDMSGKILSLSSPNYATRLIEFPVLNPISTSNNPTNNLTLPLILLNASQSLNYQWITTDFQPINGIMRVNKCLPGDQFLLVESVPIIDSGANVNLQVLNTPYSYEVIIEGTVFRDEDGFSRCHLESEGAGTIGNPLRFFVDVRPNDINEQIGLFSVGCFLNKTGTDTVKMQWGLNSQSANPITGCLNAYRSSNLGNTLVYTNCTTGSSIERTIPVTGFDYHVSGTLTQNNFTISCDNTIVFQEDSTVLALFGLNAVLGIVLLIMSLSLFFAGNGEAQMIGAIIGIIGAWVLGIVAFNWIIISAFIGFILIILSVGRYGRA